MIYAGTLHLPDMDPLVRKAYSIWSNQKYRCNNIKCKEFKYYGAKGIKVKYSPREFIGWYLAEHKKKMPKKPSIGRIDHSKNYELGNIELVEAGENTREMLMRTGGNKQGDPIVCVYPDKTVAYRSMGYAAKALGTNASTLLIRIRNKKKNKSRVLRRKMNFEICALDDFLKGSIGNP